MFKRHCLAAMLALPALAQSHDPKSPTPLGPGVNKGNVDNVTGAVYYSFTGGPGRVVMNFGYKSLGVFGNPLKQTLSFDVYEGSTFLSHSQIVSTDRLERIAPAGDLDHPRVFTIYVIPQKGAIRLGGYFEIEVTGAVHFGAAKATGEGTAPVDTRLVQGQQALTNGPVSLTNGPVSLTNGPVELTKGPVALTTGQVSLLAPGVSLVDTPQRYRVILAADILFDFDKATIRPDAAKALHEAARFIREHSRGPVRVEGYTDAKGSPRYNLNLSSSRAVAVQTWLAARESLNAQMIVEGFGAARPVAPNTKPDGSDDPIGRQKNRRVEIVILK